jgi:hypothetical protein
VKSKRQIQHFNVPQFLIIVHQMTQTHSYCKEFNISRSSHLETLRGFPRQFRGSQSLSQTSQRPFTTMFQGLFASRSEMNEYLREWLSRRRLEERALMRAALSTPENLSAMRVFRNPRWDAELQEGQNLGQGMSAMFPGNPGQPSPAAPPGTALDPESAERLLQGLPTEMASPGGINSP